MNPKTSWLAAGIILGSVIGAVVGSATHQMGAWLFIGTGVGLAIAIAITDNKVCAPKQKSDSELKAKSQ